MERPARDRLWRKIGLEKNYLEGTSYSDWSRVSGVSQCLSEKVEKSFNHANYALLNEVKYEPALINQTIQSNLHQEFYIESSLSKDGDCKKSLIQGLNSSVFQFGQDTYRLRSVERNSCEIKGSRREGRELGDSNGCGYRKVGEIGFKELSSVDYAKNDNIKINNFLSMNSYTTPTSKQPQSKSSSSFPRTNHQHHSYNIRPGGKTEKKSNFYSQYVKSTKNEVNREQKQYHLHNTENNSVQSPQQIEIVQCDQMVTLLAQQYDVLRKDHSRMINLKRSILPLVNNNFKQFKQHFNQQKSRIAQQLSLFKQSLFTVIQHMVRQRTQQYVNEIDYLYGENGTLLAKIQVMELQSKQSQHTITSLQHELKQKHQQIIKLTHQLTQATANLTSLQSKFTKQHQAQILKLQTNLTSRLNQKTNQLLTILQTNTQQYQHIIEKIFNLLSLNDMQTLIDSIDLTQSYNSHSSIVEILMKVRAEKIVEDNRGRLGLEQNDGVLSSPKNETKKTGFFGNSMNKLLNPHDQLLSSLSKKHITNQKAQSNKQPQSPTTYKPHLPYNSTVTPTIIKQRLRIKTQNSPQIQQQTSRKQSKMRASFSAYINKLIDHDNIRQTISTLVYNKKHSNSVLNLTPGNAPPNSPRSSTKYLLQPSRKSSPYFGCDQYTSNKKRLLQHKRIASQYDSVKHDYQQQQQSHVGFVLQKGTQNSNHFKNTKIHKKSLSSNQLSTFATASNTARQYNNPSPQYTKHQGQFSSNLQLFHKKQPNNNKTFYFTTQLSKEKSISPPSQSRSKSSHKFAYLPLNTHQSGYVNAPMSQRNFIGGNYVIGQHDGSSYSKRVSNINNNNNNNRTLFNLTPQKHSNSPSFIKNHHNKTTLPTQISPYSKVNKLITQNQNHNKTYYFKKH